jgi:hypothetical protein
VSNPPRQKGTKEETAFVNDWNAYFGSVGNGQAIRMPAGSRYDIHVSADDDDIVDVLSTKADRTERLVTLRFKDFMRLWGKANQDYDFRPTLRVESKRYRRFALHGIFFSKFGAKR